MGRARPPEHPDLGDGGGDVEREVGVADADRHLQHEIAVGAQRLDRQLAQVAAEGRLLRVDQRQEDLGADVARAPAAAPLRGGHEPQLAAHHVEGTVAVDVRAVGGVERPEHALALGLGAVTGDVGQRIDLEVERSGAVGDDVVFEGPVA